MSYVEGNGLYGCLSAEAVVREADWFSRQGDSKQPFNVKLMGRHSACLAKGTSVCLTYG